MAVHNSELNRLGQSQIIAKATISAVGIYVAAQIYTTCYRAFMNSREIALMPALFYVITAVALLTTIIFFMVLNNDWLIRKIPLAAESVPVKNPEKSLIFALRICFVFLGLILLAQSTPSIAYTIQLIKIPFIARQWFSDIFNGNGIKWRPFIRGFFEIFKILFIAYLIFSGNGPVNRIVKKQFKNREDK